MCRREHLHQVDLLTPAEKKITDREYHAKHRGQKKLNERNKQILADGLIPRKTEFQTQKEFLRSAIEDAASRSCNQEDFQSLLLEKYNIKLKVSRGRFSYLHPERNKYILDISSLRAESHIPALQQSENTISFSKSFLALSFHPSAFYSVIIRTLLFQLFYMDNRSNTSSI